MIGTKLEQKCPRCGGVLGVQSDNYEWYFNCVMCAREYDTEMRPRRMTPKELKKHYGIWQLKTGRPCK